MSLSVAQKRQNQEPLDTIVQLAVTLQANAASKEADIAIIMSAIESVLDEHEILLGIPAGDKALQLEIEGALTAQTLKQFNLVEFKKRLLQWALFYKQEEVNSDKQLRALMPQSSNGLLQSLIATGNVSDNTWGDENDLRFVLKNLITHPNTIREVGTYVLPPIAILAAESASAEEKRTQSLFLENTLREALKDNADKNLDLLIPVNCQQNHWRLVQVIQREGTIKQVILLDSLENKQSKNDRALASLQKAVRPFIDAKTEIKATSTGTQKNGSSCMDHVVKNILEIVPQEVSPLLKEIRAAKTETALREAVVKVCETHPKINKNGQVNQSMQQFFNQPITKESLANKVFTTFTDRNALQNPALKKWQVRFDELMARNLETLFKNNPHVKDESSLVDQAREEAFLQLKKSSVNPN